MTREEALRQADEDLCAVVVSGYAKIFRECTVNGVVDHGRLVAAMLRARERLADMIMEMGAP